MAFAAALTALVLFLCAAGCVTLLCAALFAPQAPLFLKILLAAILSGYYALAAAVFGSALLLLEAAHRLMNALAQALGEIVLRLCAATGGVPAQETDAVRKASAAAFATQVRNALGGTPKYVLAALVLIFALLGFAAPGFLKRGPATATAVLGGLQLRILLFKALAYAGLLVSFLLPILVLP